MKENFLGGKSESSSRKCAKGRLSKQGEKNISAGGNAENMLSHKRGELR